LFRSDPSRRLRRADLRRRRRIGRVGLSRQYHLTPLIPAPCPTGDNQNVVTIGEWGAMSPMAFVGRGRELAALDNWLRLAAGGQGGLVLVDGEPGLGKTTLAAELARSARA